VSPDSLLWKYYGDRRISLLGARAGTTENMHPQLGQAVSEHSVIFHDLFERVRRSAPQILASLYSASPEAGALRIRNFHKSLKGTMPEGSRFAGTPYKGLDPETFYWAHATFLDMTYACVERFVRPLTLAEKEQLFQESRDWYSLYGVEDSAQPSSYLEFREYWDRTVREDLLGDTRIAQYSVGYMKGKGLTRAFPVPRSMPPWLWHKVVAPAVDSFAAFIGAGGLDPDLREKLGVEWTHRQERRYARFCKALRLVGPAWERFAPLRWRYAPEAVEAFERTGTDPRKIQVRQSRPEPPKARQR
jgi:uncharacterized protein (DUF2236 family)